MKTKGAAKLTEEQKKIRAALNSFDLFKHLIEHGHPEDDIDVAKYMLRHSIHLFCQVLDQDIDLKFLFERGSAEADTDLQIEDVPQNPDLH